MKMKETRLVILEELTDEYLSGHLGLDLYGEGLLDSMATVQMLFEINGRLDSVVPVSEYERGEWLTPQHIIEKVTA